MVTWLFGLVYFYPKPLLTYIACVVSLAVAIVALNIALNRFIYKERGWRIG